MSLTTQTRRFNDYSHRHAVHEPLELESLITTQPKELATSMAREYVAYVFYSLGDTCTYANLFYFSER
jgi:hypothetical protein